MPRTAESRRAIGRDAEGGQRTRGQAARPTRSSIETIISQGHARPTPAFGAPALVWHVAIWPRRSVEARTASEACDPHDTAGEKHIEAKARPSSDAAQLWIEQINALPGERCSAKSCHPEGRARARWRKDLQARHAARSRVAADARRSGRVLQAGRASWSRRSLPVHAVVGGPPASDDTAARQCHPGVRAPRGECRLRLHQLLHGHRPALECRSHSAGPVEATGTGADRLLEAVEDVRTICERPARAGAAGGVAPVDLPAVAGSSAQPRRDARRGAAARGPQGGAQPALCRHLGGVLGGDGLPAGGHRRRRAARCSPTSAASSCRPRALAARRPPTGPTERRRPPRSARCRSPTSAATAPSTPTAPRPTPWSRRSGRSCAASRRVPTSASSSPAAC